MQTTGSQQAEKQLFNRPGLRSLFLLVLGLRRHCYVVGDSMLPTLQEGDMVIYRPIKPGKFSPQKGSIVVVKDPIDLTTLIIKRVHQANSLGLELRGDNNINSIDSRKYGLVNHNYLRGVVEQIIPKVNSRIDRSQV